MKALYLLLLAAASLGAGLATGFKKTLPEPVKVINKSAAAEASLEWKIHPKISEILGLNSRTIRRLNKLKKEDFRAALEAAIQDGDYDFVRELILEWVKIDPDSTIAFFLEQGKVSIRMGGGGDNYGFSEEVFGALVRSDPQYAVAAALRFPSNERYLNSVLEMIATKSPDLAVSLALEHLDRFPRRGYIDLGAEANTMFAKALAQRELFGTVEKFALRSIQ